MKRTLRTPLPHPAIAGAMLIPLSRGMSAVIDSADADVVARFHWHATPGKRTWYAASAGSRRLHRFLWQLWGLELPESLDHINGDGLDNRRTNLRAATQFQNHGNMRRPMTNTSGYKGVSWNRRRRKWRAQIFAHGRSRALGHFDDPKEAHAAYLAAARDLFGDFARAA